MLKFDGWSKFGWLINDKGQQNIYVLVETNALPMKDVIWVFVKKMSPSVIDLKG